MIYISIRQTKASHFCYTFYLLRNKNYCMYPVYELNITRMKSEGSSVSCIDVITSDQSELPRPIPQNSVESAHGCTSRIYFDNVGDNVTLTLYSVTLTPQKPW